jgi:hypothetical protein
MVDTAADTGFGVILKKETSTPGTYTDYGLEIVSVNGIGFSRSSIDATHMASPDEYAEFIHGLRTTKPMTVGFNWVPSGTGALQTILDGAKANYQVQFPDNSTMTVKAALTDFDAGGLTPDGKMEGTAIFTPSGKATWA